MPRSAKIKVAFELSTTFHVMQFACTYMYIKDYLRILKCSPQNILRTTAIFTKECSVRHLTFNLDFNELQKDQECTLLWHCFRESFKVNDPDNNEQKLLKSMELFLRKFINS